MKKVLVQHFLFCSPGKAKGASADDGATWFSLVGK